MRKVLIPLSILFFFCSIFLDADFITGYYNATLHLNKFIFYASQDLGQFCIYLYVWKHCSENRFSKYASLFAIDCIAVDLFFLICFPSNVFQATKLQWMLISFGVYTIQYLCRPKWFVVNKNDLDINQTGKK